MMESKNAILEAETGKLKEGIAALEVKMVRIYFSVEKPLLQNLAFQYCCYSKFNFYEKY